MKYLLPVKVFFTKHKRALIKHSLYAAGYFFLAMAAVGLRVFHPLHFLVALPFLVLCLRHLFSILLLDSHRIQKSSAFRRIKQGYRSYATYIFLCLFIGIFFYVTAQVIPSDKNPFAGMTDAELAAHVDESLTVSVLYLDQLEVTGTTLLDSGLLTKETLTADELALLKTYWDDFIQATRDSEQITEIHRYFNQISYWSLRDTHTKSFVISYTLYLKKFELFGRIIALTGNNERVIKALNENSAAFGGKGSYYDIRDRHVGDETFLRRNLGRAYLWFLETTVDTTTFGEDFNAFVRESKDSYAYLFANPFTTIGIVTAKHSSDIENGLFNSWFPIQKNVADTMGKIQVSARKVPLISYDDVDRMRDTLEPGDILIERRNWHVSNVGIPGFWPHAALHLGTLETASTFFAELFPYRGYDSFALLLETEHPNFYAQYQNVDMAGYPYAVIEGQAPGIILQSLEKSAMADYVGVLRPRLEKEATLQAILRAIGNYGKPYDYNFDFETRDEIVCSELVYDAYLKGDNKPGLTFALTETSGRKIVSPNDMVKKFYEEHGTPEQELDFVYFIDGNENLKKAFVKDENAFLTTWTRSKFSHLQE